MFGNRYGSKYSICKALAAILLACVLLVQSLPSARAEEDWESVVSNTLTMSAAKVEWMIPDPYGGGYEPLGKLRYMRVGAALKELPKPPELEGFCFVGWQTEDGTPVTEETVVEGDVCYYAFYKSLVFSEAVEGLSVEITVGEDALPPDARFRLTPVDGEEVRGIVESALGSEVGTVLAVDMGFANDAGTDLVPAEKVTVNMALTGIGDTAKIAVVHIGDDGKAEVVYNDVPGSVKMRGQSDRKVFSFETGSFSIYAVAGIIEKYYLASDGNTYKITLEYGSDAMLPEDIDLTVSEVDSDQEAFYDYIDRASQALGGMQVFYARVFDISIVDREDPSIHYQPQAQVKVSIQLLDVEEGTKDFSVVHFADEAETLDAQTDGNTVSFSAGSFSAYAIVSGPDAVPIGWKKVASAAELSAFAEEGKGVYIGQISGYYFRNTETVTSDGQTGVTKTKPAQSSPAGSAAALYYFEQASDGKFFLYCYSGETKKYLKNTGTSSLYLTDNEDEKTAFTVTVDSDGRFMLSNGAWYVNMQNGANGTRSSPAPKCAAPTVRS